MQVIDLCRHSPTPFHLQPVVRYLASKIYGASNGLVYPINLSAERFQGAWSYAGKAQGRLLKPFLAPNVTVQYALREPHGPANLSFHGNDGTVQFKLTSVTPYASVPQLQDVSGEIAIHDGSSALLDARLTVPVRGVYAADQGLLYLAGSSEGGRISISDGSMPSGSPSPSASPSVSASSTVAPPSPLASSSAQAVATASSTPSRAASSVGMPSPTTATGRILQGVPPSDPHRCDLLIAVRFRPIDYQEAWVPPPAPTPPPPPSAQSPGPSPSAGAGRRMVGTETSYASAYETRWPAWTGGEEGEGAAGEGRGQHSPNAPHAHADSAPGATLSSAYLPRIVRDVASMDYHGSGQMGSSHAAEGGGDGVGVGSDAHLQALFTALQTWASSASQAVDSGAWVGDAASEVENDIMASSFGRRLQSRPEGAPGHARRLLSMPITNQYAGMRYLPLHGYIVSPNCDFSMNVSAAGVAFSYSTIEDKIGGFVFAATLGGVMLLVMSTYQIVASSSASWAGRVSLATVGMQWVLDGMAAFMYTAGGVVLVNLVTSFAIPAFLHFALFVFIQVRFMLLIRKARNPNIFNGGASVLHRELCKMYLLLYPLLLVAFMVMYNGSASTVRFMLTLAYSYWLPQIVHSASMDSRSLLTRGYIFTTTVVRLFPLAYALCCPWNVAWMLMAPEPLSTALQWKESEMPAPMKQTWMMLSGQAPAFLTPGRTAVFWSWARFGLFLLAWQTAQVVVMLLQEKSGWGPRFFVPYAFLPAKYDYHRPVRVEAGRVVPDPSATGPWLRHLEPEAPTGAAAAGAAGQGAAAGAGNAAAVTNVMQGAVMSIVHDIASMARSASSSARWFATGCHLLGRDMWKYTSSKVRRMRAGGRGRGWSFIGMAFGGGADSIGRSVSGPVPGGAVESSVAVSSSPASWLDLMSPRQRIGEQGPGGLGLSTGSGGTRYTRLDGSQEEEQGVPGRTSTGGGGGGEDVTGMPTLLDPKGAGLAAPLTAATSLHAAEEGRVGIPAAPGGGEAGVGGASALPSASTSYEDDGTGTVGDASWGSIDCVVCMEGVSFPCRRVGYMVTPCDHIFHTQCLRPWMTRKPECPTCRMQLPEP